MEFQSTRPMRDATVIRNGNSCFLLFQSTRPMRDATYIYWSVILVNVISIHASHAGRDRTALAITVPLLSFQSTRPMRDATKSETEPTQRLIFQSTRPMRDATLACFVKSLARLLFQSTRPMRDATHLRSC